MPEGDTYYRAAQRVRPVLLDQVVEAVEGSAPQIRRNWRHIAGHRVEEVRTLGKHLIVDLEGGRSIHVHLGMSGSIDVHRPGRRRSGDAVRMALTTSAGTVRVLGAPEVDFLKREEVDLRLARLGPDLLADEFDWGRFEAAAARYPDSRTVSDFLLDQRVMSGIGNEYKSEILFLERVLPERRMAEVDTTLRRRLAERARRLMAANTERAQRTTAGRGDGSVWVYGRAGQPCRRCRTAVASAWLGDPVRITYWCPGCQR